MYIRIFWPLRSLVYGAYAGAAATVLFYVAILAVDLAYSAPAPGQSMLDNALHPRPCPGINLNVLVTAFGLALDVYILVLPIAGLSTLQMPLKRKIGVMMVFLTGLLCVHSALSPTVRTEYSLMQRLHRVLP